MINTNELMIGNYVKVATGEQLNDEVGKVMLASTKWHGQVSVRFPEGGEDEYEDDQLALISPIKITPEWLERLGMSLEKRAPDSKVYETPINTHGWLFGVVVIRDEEIMVYFRRHDANNVCSIDVKYVHQLQNIVYALTKQTLTLDSAGGEL